MNRIGRKQAAAIAGVHTKTLERYEQDPEFKTRTGYFKAARNGFVYYDEQKFRTYVAELMEDPSILSRSGSDNGHNLSGKDSTTNLDNSDTLEPENSGDSVSPENGEVTALVKRSMSEQAGFSPVDVLAGLSEALLIPHKLFLTKKEAKALTGIPEAQLHRLSKIIAGRRLIKRSDLEKAKF